MVVTATAPWHTCLVFESISRTCSSSSFWTPIKQSDIECCVLSGWVCSTYHLCSQHGVCRWVHFCTLVHSEGKESEMSVLKVLFQLWYHSHLKCHRSLWKKLWALLLAVGYHRRVRWQSGKSCSCACYLEVVSQSGPRSQCGGDQPWRVYHWHS